MSEERWTIGANVMQDRAFRLGAKVDIILFNPGGGSDKVCVRGVSKGGRTITKWIASKRLGNFRPSFHPEGIFSTKAEAQSWCDRKLVDWSAPT